MYGGFNNIKLSGMAAMVPTHESHNAELAGILGEKVVRKQILATGIESRHYVVDGQNAVDLSVGAAKTLLDELNWNVKDIKVLLYVSSYTLFSIPSTAFYIQQMLGIGTDCVAFDINLACSGFVVGTEVLCSLLQHCEAGEKGLLLVGVNPSSVESVDKREAFPLFGDGGGAAAFEVSENNQIFFSNNSDGTRWNQLYKENMDSPLQMDGMGVFNFTISQVADSINDFYKHFNLDKKSVDYFFLHQAQKFILDKLMDFCELEVEKCPVCYKYFGNTGAVSIPLNMCYHATDIDYSKPLTLFMSGFGAGLSWANLWVKTDNMVILPIIYSDEKLVDI